MNPKSPPSAALARCGACRDLMVLLLQLHGDLPETFPEHERWLYIFACRRMPCRRKAGSIKAIRSTRISPTKTKITTKNQGRFSGVSLPSKLPSQDLGGSIFGSSMLSNAAMSSKDSSGLFSTAQGSPLANPFKSMSSSFKSALDPSVGAVTVEPSLNFAQKARLAEPPTPAPLPASYEPWPPESQIPPAYSSYYLDADYETMDSSPISAASAQIMCIEDSDATGSKEDTERFESTIDRTFQRFADRLGQNPDQVLRYHFRGTPLLYSRSDVVGKLLEPQALLNSGDARPTAATARGIGSTGIPNCSNCGAPRVFELQLTPHAITELEVGDEDEGLDGMDWGTVILGVCVKDCPEKGVGFGEVGYVEEWVGVQWEEIGS